jgi:hypothetical protein
VPVRRAAEPRSRRSAGRGCARHAALRQGARSNGARGRAARRAVAARQSIAPRGPSTHGPRARPAPPPPAPRPPGRARRDPHLAVVHLALQERHLHAALGQRLRGAGTAGATADHRHTQLAVAERLAVLHGLDAHRQGAAHLAAAHGAARRRGAEGLGGGLHLVSLRVVRFAADWVGRMANGVAGGAQLQWRPASGVRRKTKLDGRCGMEPPAHRTAPTTRAKALGSEPRRNPHRREPAGPRPAAHAPRPCARRSARAARRAAESTAQGRAPPGRAARAALDAPQRRSARAPAQHGGGPGARGRRSVRRRARPRCAVPGRAAARRPRRVRAAAAAAARRSAAGGASG